MNYTELQLSRIADSLERLANTIDAYLGKDFVAVQDLKEVLSNEEELFLLLTKVYKEEEENKRKEGLKRKPSRTVSKKINYQLEVFLEEKLENAFSVISDNGFQIIKKDGHIVAVFKIFTDLGRYGRGALWYQTIQRIVNQVYKDYGVPSNNVFFLVSSIYNGIDNQHIQHILEKRISNADILTPEYRKELENYLFKYVDSMTVLPNPHDQIYFLSADYHPNVIGTECVEHGDRVLENLKQYQWLQPSITQLLSYINKNLCLAHP